MGGARRRRLRAVRGGRLWARAHQAAMVESDDAITVTPTSPKNAVTSRRPCGSVGMSP